LKTGYEGVFIWDFLGMCCAIGTCCDELGLVLEDCERTSENFSKEELKFGPN